MPKGGRQKAFRGSRDVARPAAAIRLEELPSEAVECIAQHASTPSTPAACLLPLVCRSWGTAAGRAQLLVDIEVDLGPHLLHPAVDLDATSSLPASGVRITRARAAAASAAAAAAPPAALLRGRQLAAWLAKKRGSVRSLCIPRGPLYGPAHCREGWTQDLKLISKALTARQRAAAAAGPPLPHLVQLELPVMGLPGTAAMLKGLAGCTSLQQLDLEPPYRMEESPISLKQMGAALSPFTQLQTLYLQWPCQGVVMGECMADLLQQLPASLEQVHLDGLRCHHHDSIPLSSISHLVNLRAWELSSVPEVEDDISSSSSSSGTGHGAAGLTALTSLRCDYWLRSSDARLQAPNMRVLYLNTGADREAWPVLQGMQNLRRLIVYSQTEAPARLGDLTQLQGLCLVRRQTPYHLQHHHVKAWAPQVASLVQLKALRLPAVMVLAGGRTLLTPLTQLEGLVVDFPFEGLPAAFVPPKARGWAATPAGAVVQVVAAAVAAGWKPLQRLMLWDPTWRRLGVEQATAANAAAGAALPGVEVEVRWDMPTL